MTLDLTAYRILTFDCYGTLIDWETGIVDALRPVLSRRSIELGDEEILELFGSLETGIQQPPYKTYREVLGLVLDAIGERLGFTPDEDERSRFAGSVAVWPAFPDSSEALKALGRHYDLVILSNVDDDLFAGSARILGVEFTDVVTAQQVGSYKPDRRNFEVLLERLGRPREEILHVAQSLYHDIAPANDLGLSTVWVNRRHGREGSGATPPQDARPDLEVPDLATLARLVDETFAG